MREREPELNSNIYYVQWHRCIIASNRIYTNIHASDCLTPCKLQKQLLFHLNLNANIHNTHTTRNTHRMYTYLYYNWLYVNVSMYRYIVYCIVPTIDDCIISSSKCNEIPALSAFNNDNNNNNNSHFNFHWFRNAFEFGFGFSFIQTSRAIISIRIFGKGISSLLCSIELAIHWFLWLLWRGIQWIPSQNAHRQKRFHRISDQHNTVYPKGNQSMGYGINSWMKWKISLPLATWLVKLFTRPKTVCIFSKVILSYVFELINIS